MNLFLQITSLLLLLLVTGVFWGPLFALHRSLKVFTSDELIKIVKTIADNLAVPMRIMMPACIVCMTVYTWVYQPQSSTAFYLSTVAILFIVLSLIITVVVEVPIVTNIQTWAPQTVPSDWQAIRDKWVKFHFLRTGVAILSFICFSISLLLN